MKARSLVSCILLSILVILLFSTAAQATKYKEVNATDILKQIENGEDVNYTDCRIVGELNVSTIKLETAPNPSYHKLLNEGYDKDALIEYGLRENLCVIKSNITLENSIFENGSNFSGVLFDRVAYFNDTTFNNDSSFSEVTFNNDSSFEFVTFNDVADFGGTTFNNDSSFEYVTFNKGSTFGLTTFNGVADFGGTTFNANDDCCIIFREAEFNSYAYFWDVIFNSFADFTGATFNGAADFGEAIFNNGSSFEYVTFKNDTDFTEVTFNDPSNFSVSDTSENIITDGKTCELFMNAYKNEARYSDADNIYYNFRKKSMENESSSYSKLGDYLSWITCGYGVRLSHTIRCVGFIIGFFALFIYWPFSGIYLESDAKKWSVLSLFEALLFSIREFTSLGSGQYPKGIFSRLVVTLEGLFGWIMLGIFMATLTNVMMRS